MFKGVLPALVTPFKKDAPHAIDEDALRRHVDDQIRAGVSGLVPCGTTGEAATLDEAEYERVLRVVVEETRRRVPVVAGAGTNDTRTSIARAEVAKKVGADGLLLVTPYYNKPTQEGLFQHFCAVVRAVPLPTILYNVPSRTSVDLLPDTVARLAEAVPEIVAIKEATGTVQRTQQILQKIGDRLRVLSGEDALHLPLLAVGAVGIISTSGNVAPQKVVAVEKAFWAGDLAVARAQHYALLPLYDAMFVETNPGPVKAALARLGRIAPVIRSPLVLPTGKSMEVIEAALRKVGLLAAAG